MSTLVSRLIQNGYLKSDAIIDAFSKINRIEFVGDELSGEAERDIALPIGHGQTISQPMTVAFMLELLDPKPGQNILDVGSGSGWTTALLGQIVGEKGRVIGLEIIDELIDKGKENAEKFGFISRKITEFKKGDGYQGMPELAPYDRILVSASCGECPSELKKQLKVGGKMVIPINQSLVYLEKKSEDEFMREEFPGFYFVPLVKKN